MNFKKTFKTYPTSLIFSPAYNPAINYLQEKYEIFNQMYTMQEPIPTALLGIGLISLGINLRKLKTTKKQPKTKPQLENLIPIKNNN